jgi:hypothetical protein
LDFTQKKVFQFAAPVGRHRHPRNAASWVSSRDVDVALAMQEQPHLGENGSHLRMLEKTSTSRSAA